MRWINNYAWYGRKAISCVLPFIIGVIAEQNIPGNAMYIILPAMVAFGWARKTKAANDVWFKGNRGPVEDLD